LNLENLIDKNQKNMFTDIQFYKMCPILIKTQVKGYKVSKNPKKHHKLKKAKYAKKKQN
jgi:hypothetical protein